MDFGCLRCMKSISRLESNEDHQPSLRAQRSNPAHPGSHARLLRRYTPLAHQTDPIAMSGTTSLSAGDEVRPKPAVMTVKPIDQPSSETDAAVGSNPERIPTAAQIFDFHPPGTKANTWRQPFEIEDHGGPLEIYRKQSAAMLKQLQDPNYQLQHPRRRRHRLRPHTDRLRFEVSRPPPSFAAETLQDGSGSAPSSLDEMGYALTPWRRSAPAARPREVIEPRTTLL